MILLRSYGAGGLLAGVYLSSLVRKAKFPSQVRSPCDREEEGGWKERRKKKVHEAVVCVAAVLFTDCNYRYRSMVDNDDDG